MQDHGLVKSLQTRRTSTLALVYDLYAKPLYGYCWLLLHDQTAAEAALRDTFLVAELRIDELGDPGRLKPWLFAIARGEAARRRTVDGAHGQRHHQGLGPSPATAGSVAPRSMAEAAVESLDPAEREALELAERHGLVEADVALVLDLSVRRTYALLSRARQRLREALTAVILARTGREQCRRLAALTKSEGGLDIVQCRRVRRHASMCRKCGQRGSHRASAAKVLTLLAPVEMPAELRWQILSSYSDPALISYRLHVARRVGALDSAGFPLPGGRRRRAGRQRAAAAAVTCLLVVVASALAMPRFQPSDTPDGRSLPLPGDSVRSTPYLASAPTAGRSAHRPPPRPSPSPGPLDVRHAAAGDRVTARSRPTAPIAPIAAAAGPVRVWAGVPEIPPVFEVGRSGDHGGSPPDSSGRASKGAGTAGPSASPGRGTSPPHSESSVRDKSSSPARTTDTSRTWAPGPSSKH